MKDQAASIRFRLLAHSKQAGVDYQRVLTRYAIERLLFRLSQSTEGKRYILKGAMLFVTWPEHIFRPTGDLDLLGQGDPDPAVIAAFFAQICRIEVPEDGIIFDPATVKVDPVREDDKYQGARLSLTGILAKAEIRVQVDIGFGDRVHPAPRRQTFPLLLDGLPIPELLMYPPETVVAEKFEAMLRFGEANSRIKDFYDIWITSRTFRFDLSTLAEAVRGTLQQRDTAIPTNIPIALSRFAQMEDKHALWDGFLARNPPTQAPPPFADLLTELRAFFAPLFDALARPEGAHGQWEPDRGQWAVTPNAGERP